MDSRDPPCDEDEVEFFNALEPISDPEDDNEEEALSDATTTSPFPPLEIIASDASDGTLSDATTTSTLPLETIASGASELTSEVPPQKGDASLGREGDTEEPRLPLTPDASLGCDGHIEEPPQPLTLLEYAVDIVIKAVSFQITLLVIFVKLPFWLIRLSFLIVVDPYGVIWRAGNEAKDRVSGAFKFFSDKVLPAVYAKLGENQAAANLVVRLVRGCFCSLYICFVLFAFLVASFLVGGLMVRRVLEEPVQVTEELSFDYTKASPEALVPVSWYGGCSFSGEKVDFASHDVWRLVPPNQKMRLTISLTLPESDYNRNLGVFQVRAEFLASNGNVTSSSRQPGILRFKSTHIRLMETFMKSMFLLAGYSSESQVLSLQLRGLTEGTRPTVCIRVTLENRAEFRAGAGAGIPEIYAASMKLESELSFFERMIWNWRMTIFIWTSIVLFLMQLMLVLLCCSRLVIPRE